MASYFYQTYCNRRFIFLQVKGNILFTKVPSTVASPFELFLANNGVITAESAAIVQINNYRKDMTLEGGSFITTKAKEGTMTSKPQSREIGPYKSESITFTSQEATSSKYPYSRIYCLNIHTRKSSTVMEKYRKTALS